jgi:hypothetical protein
MHCSVSDILGFAKGGGEDYNNIGLMSTSL